MRGVETLLNGKLELVNITGGLSDLNAAIAACLRSKVFQGENAGKLMGVSDSRFIGKKGKNLYAEALEKLQDLDLQPEKSDDTGDIPLDGPSPQVIESEARRVSGQLNEVREALTQAREQINEYESDAIHLKCLRNADVDLGALARVRHISCRFGRMPLESLQKLEFYTDAGFYFQSCHTEYDYVWGFCFALPDRQSVADTVMKGLLFESYDLPKDLGDTPEQALEELDIRLTALRAKCERLEAKLRQIRETESENIARLYAYAQYQSDCCELLEKCLIRRGKFNIMGYVPVSRKAYFQECMDKIPNLSVTYKSPYKRRWKPCLSRSSNSSASRASSQS